MEKHYGIAIRITKRRDSFYTADEEMKKMMDKLAEKKGAEGRAYYSSELSVTKTRLSQLQFVIFFDTENDAFYFGEIEKMDHRKNPYTPQDYTRYYNNYTEPHKTWILLKSLFPIPIASLEYVKVYNEAMPYNNNAMDNSFIKKVHEPRFPRIYVYILDSHYYTIAKIDRKRTLDNDSWDYRYPNDSSIRYRSLADDPYLYRILDDSKPSLKGNVKKNVDED